MPAGNARPPGQPTLLFIYQGCVFRLGDGAQAPKAGSLFLLHHLDVRDGQGRFYRDLQVLGERAQTDEVRREAEAQLEAFVRRFGRSPTHLDSHHHVHRLPRLNPEARATIERLDIRLSHFGQLGAPGA